MKAIAIDVSPLYSGHYLSHRVRGVGSYINMLEDSLPKVDKKNKYFFVENKQFGAEVDLIHYPYFEPFFLTLPFLPKNKFIVTVHDLIPLVFPEHFPPGLKGSLKWIIQRYLLKTAAAVVADSECSKNDIEKIVGIKKENIKVVYLATKENFKQITNTSKLHAIKVKYKLPDNFLLYVGDVTWNKNLPGLLRAINQTDFNLVIVGKAFANRDFDRNNPWNQDLALSQKLAESNKKIIPLGFVPDHDLAQIYNLATVFIMPSFYEGFGLPVLEAMQSGCPVVTSKEGSLLEVCGEAAYFVEPESVDSIRRGIENVMGSRGLREELSKKGLRRAKKFSIEETARKTISVYEKVVTDA